MKNNLWSLEVHSNPKLIWILNYRIFMGQGNLGLELRSMGFMNFRTELILPRHVRNLGLELRSKGFMNFRTELILPRHVRNLGLELRSKGSMGFNSNLKLFWDLNCWGSM